MPSSFEQKKFGVCVLVAFALAVFAVPVAAQDSDTNQEAVDQDADTARRLKIIDSLREQLGSLEKSYSGLQDKVFEHLNTIAALKAELTEKSSALEILEAKLGEAARAASSLRSQLQGKKDLLVSMMQQIEERDGLIATFESELSGSDSSLVTLRPELATAREEIDRIRSEAEEQAEAAFADAEELVSQMTAAEADRDNLKGITAETQTLLERVEAERDALATQRTWLSILVAVALLAVGYFAMRDRKPERT